MKKQEAIQKLKEGTHAIFMNRKEPKDIKLLMEILDISFLDGDAKYYWLEKIVEDEYFKCSDQVKPLPTIKITKIEQEETFESGELVEVSQYKDIWYKGYYIGKRKSGYYCTEYEGAILSSRYIRKINPAIEQIREIMKKNNISKEDL